MCPLGHVFVSAALHGALVSSSAAHSTLYCVFLLKVPEGSVLTLVTLAAIDPVAIKIVNDIDAMERVRTLTAGVALVEKVAGDQSWVITHHTS